MKISLSQATLATVAYADIFSYPLTKEEIRYWQIFYEDPVKLTKSIGLSAGYYFLAGRRDLVRVRQRRTGCIENKFQIAQVMADQLKILPTIRLVGVTGGLAVGNAEPADDIDLFIITAGKTLWITRLLATIIVELSGKRRHPREKEIGDSICLNMFMTEDHLALPKADRDLFAAHEVLQMKPLWERNHLYRKFLTANQWVRYFLPNAWDEKSQTANLKSQKFNSQPGDLVLTFALYILRLFEQPLKVLQLRYMRRHRTTEVITDSVIRFHPRDARSWVKEKLQKRLSIFNIPLDSVFYNR